MINNFSYFLDKNATNFPEKLFCEEINGQTINYKKFNLRVNQCCRLLQGYKSKKKFIVSLYFENSIEFLILYFACIRSNLIVNPLPYSISISELKKNLVSINSDLIVSNKNVLHQLPINSTQKLEINDLLQFYNILNEYDTYLKFMENYSKE